MRRIIFRTPAHGIRKGNYLLAGIGVYNEEKKYKKENVGA
mgnify:CR=1 FL=1